MVRDREEERKKRKRTKNSTKIRKEMGNERDEEITIRNKIEKKMKKEKKWRGLGKTKIATIFPNLKLLNSRHEVACCPEQMSSSVPGSIVPAMRSW